MNTTDTLTRPRPSVSAQLLKQFMHQYELDLVYAGEFGEEEQDQYLDMIESRLQTMVTEKKLKKRIFYIVVECVQNISRHKAPVEMSGDQTPSILALGHDDGNPYILTANPIKLVKKASLKDRLDIVNTTAKEELKSLYRTRLSEGKHNGSGGADLGLIDIARKSGHPLEYNFEPINEATCYFTLKVRM